MNDKEKTLQDYEKAIVTLGTMVFEQSFRMMALEAILQEHGLLKSGMLDELELRYRKEFSTIHAQIGAQGQLDAAEKRKKDALEALREFLVRFEGPIQ